MPPKEPRDAPVSAYVKMRLRALERSGTDQKEIAKRAAVAPSLVNQLLRTPQGVGPRSADRWARFLGFPDAFAMNREVERWWKAEGKALYEKDNPHDPFPNRAEAAHIARRFGATDEDIRHACERWAGYEGESVLQWLAWFHDEVKRRARAPAMGKKPRPA